MVYRVTEDGNILYLLLQAAPGKPWGFPKGKVDEGETEAMAAHREIAEEAGLRHVEFDPAFRHVVHYVYRRGRSLVNKEVVYFLARANTADVALSWEHVAFRWATMEDALLLVFYENARDTLLDAHQALCKLLSLSSE